MQVTHSFSQKLRHDSSKASGENQNQQPLVTDKIAQEENRNNELIRMTCTKLTINKILEKNDVQSKSTPRPIITLNTSLGLSCKWFFDTGAAISCISKETLENANQQKT
jgi:hypothetical protein